MPMVATQMIVLSKQPYRESALLLAGISPDCGKLSLVAHGAQKLSETKFPAADLFRELDVEFDDAGASELRTAKRLELVTGFDALADRPRHFQLAGRIGSFLLKNAAPELPLPYTYDALRGVLFQLCRGDDEPDRWTMEQCAVVIRITYLYENGLLPEPSEGEQAEFQEKLVAAGVENSPLPSCPAAYWKTLNQWLAGLCEYHKLYK